MVKAPFPTRLVVIVAAGVTWFSTASVSRAEQSVLLFNQEPSKSFAVTTNGSPDGVMNSSDMGVLAFNLATSVDLIIAQRLARRLCSHCKSVIDVPKETLLAEGFTEDEIDTGFDVFEAKSDGCDKCNNGYKGRVGIYEVVKITPELSRIIMEEGNSLQLAEQAQVHGYNNLRRSGLQKVIQGVTSLAETNRKTTGH